ncbi:phage tail tube protein [Halomarina rubra]|uniref:Phage tail tube protein n=1 Tax=Halomarina rubra TaxID=2071873 RepID=A0ABD6AS19_9EURY
MTGAQSIAYVHEDAGYAETPNDADHKVPGKDTSVTDLGLENGVQRLRNFSAQAKESIATTFEGSIGVSFVLCEPWILNSVFGSAPSAGGESSAPYSYTWKFTPGRVQSSRWFIGTDYLTGTSGTGTCERELKGVVFPQMQVQIQQGEPVRVDCTGFYGDEAKSTQFTVTDVPEPAADPLIFHGGSLAIPSDTDLVKMREATLDVQTGARPQRGWNRKPVDAVLGNVETTLDLQKAVTGTNLLSMAYGNSTAPATSGVDGAADGTLRFQSPGANALEFQLTGVTPDSYNWDNLGDYEGDVLENVSCVVDQLTAVAESASDTAR